MQQALNGNLDPTFLIPFQVYQTMVFNIIKTTVIAAFSPTRVAWSPDKGSFIYAYDMAEGVV